MNKVILIGRLTKDAEIRHSRDTTIAHITLAVDRPIKKEGEANADFIRCVTFNKLAEMLYKYGRKGIKFVIEGRWQTSNYKNDDGKWVNTNECVIERLEFAESKANSDENRRENGNKINNNISDDFMSIPDGLDEEFPFM